MMSDNNEENGGAGGVTPSNPNMDGNHSNTQDDQSAGDKASQVPGGQDK